MKEVLLLVLLASLGCAPPPLVYQVASWRGSTKPDSLDEQLAKALSTPGEFLEGSDMVFAYSADSTLEPLARPAALPRLVDCMGRDQRAAATWQRARVLVGVVCFQAILRSDYFQSHDFPDSSWVAYQNPPLSELREAQAWWRRQLRRQPP
jgi:hypothetical protein